MRPAGKATRIRLFEFKSIQMRTFHMAWLAFHLCFFGWFGVAPLMAVIREDLALTQAQIGNTIIASVAGTVFVRLAIGPLIDRYGPRRVYAWLMIAGAVPVMAIGLADSYETFLLGRLMIGAIGASFVVTQYHTSVMFAPNVVGTANATTAGWGNLGGGTTQILMPMLFALLAAHGVTASLGWRLAMLIPAATMVAVGIAYYRLTRDAPEGDFRDLPRGASAERARNSRATFMAAARDVRVWALAAIYGASFGVELTIHNVAAIYYFDTFDVGLRTAGVLAGSFGLLAIFARTLGGWLSDRVALQGGLKARARLLFTVLLLQGGMLIVFSQMSVLVLAASSMLVFGLCVHMACGATYGLVPFINREALGAVAGIVGAGGNAGAVAAGLLFRIESMSYGQSLFLLGLGVIVCAFCAFALRFAPETEARERHVLEEALSERERGAASANGEPSIA